MTNYGNMSSLPQRTIVQRTHTVQTINGLGITHRKGVKMILGEGHNQTCHAQNDALGISVRHLWGNIPLKTYQIWIIHDGHQAQRPFCRRNDFRMFPVQSQQGQRCFLLDERLRSSAPR